MSIDDKIRKIKKEYEWSMFAQSYFTTALISAESLLDYLQHENINTSWKYSNILVSSPRYLLIPIVYNLRHACELYLKYINKFYDDTILRGGHDLTTLSSNLIGKIRDNPETNEFAPILNNLLLLFEKYQNGLFLPTNNSFPSDKKNEASRFPEAFNETWEYDEFFKLDNESASGVSSWVNINLITTLITDIKTFSVELRNLGRFLKGRVY